MLEVPDDNVDQAGVNEAFPPDAPVEDDMLTPVSTLDPLVDRGELPRSRFKLLAGCVVVLCVGGVMAASVIPDDLQRTWGIFAGDSAKRVEESSYVHVPARAVEAARLSILTRPAGAEVSIDGRPVGSTPVAGARVSPGPHLVRVAMDGYIAVDSMIQIGASGLMDWEVMLEAEEDLAQPAPVNLAVGNTAVANTKVTGDGPERDNPARQSERPARAGSAVDQAPGPAEDSTPAVSREINEIVVADPTTQSSSLYIDVEPHGSRVILGGRYVGRTPLELGTLEAGLHHIRIEHDGYQELEQAVEVTAEGRSALTASLAQLMGEVRISAVPWGSLFVDGVLIAAESDHSHALELPVGVHRVRASHPALGSVERDIRILDGQTINIILDLNLAAGN